MAADARRPGDPPRIAVAVSGGLDSICLLHATARAAHAAGIEVHALHVHHGLHAEADEWQRCVARRCRRWGDIGLHVGRVRGRPGQGDSVEAWARQERYAALAQMALAAGCQLVLLAQHRRDQAETVLLQALRGAGPAGLAAMPRLAWRDGLLWCRPWLDHPRERIEAYARRWRLRGVQDPSNADCRLARSRIRQRIWPLLSASFTDAETAFVAVASRAQEAREVLDEVAAADASGASDARGLVRSRWLDLSPGRRANVLRHWLSLQMGRGPQESLVRRLLAELPASRDGRWPAGDIELALHGDRLVRIRPLAKPAIASRHLDLSCAGVYRFEGLCGVLRVSASRDAGVPAATLERAELGPRVGGLRFQRHPGGAARGLKKQFQDLGVPRWLRDGPVITSDGQTVFVAGLGTDARALQLPGKPRFALEWQPDID